MFFLGVGFAFWLPTESPPERIYSEKWVKTGTAEPFFQRLRAAFDPLRSPFA
jgi:hypothetical protein